MSGGRSLQAIDGKTCGQERCGEAAVLLGEGVVRGEQGQPASLGQTSQGNQEDSPSQRYRARD